MPEMPADKPAVPASGARQAIGAIRTAWFSSKPARSRAEVGLGHSFRLVS